MAPAVRLHPFLTITLIATLAQATPSWGAESEPAREAPVAAEDRQEQEKAPSERPDPPKEGDQEPGEPIEGEPIEDDPESEEISPCIPVKDPDADQFWAARMRRGVFRTVCGAATWFDGFFGDSRNLSDIEIEEEDDVLEGRLLFGLGYDEGEGFDPTLKLRAKIPLPRAKHRLNALIGRTEVDDFTSDRDRRFDRLPEALRETDDEWLVGLGYNPIRSTRFRADLDGGVRVRFPLDPFVRGRLRGVVLLEDDALIRWRQTFFWRNAKGWGVTSAADYERILGPKLLSRVALSGTFAEETQGIEYTANYSIFQSLGEGRAMAYRALIFGETDAPVAIQEYGLAVVHRRRFLRDWLYLEITPGVGWRRLEVEDNREMFWSIQFGLDMLFGGAIARPDLARE